MAPVSLWSFYPSGSSEYAEWRHQSRAQQDRHYGKSPFCMRIVHPIDLSLCIRRKMLTKGKTLSPCQQKTPQPLSFFFLTILPVELWIGLRKISGITAASYVFCFFFLSTSPIIDIAYAFLLFTEISLLILNLQCSVGIMFSSIWEIQKQKVQAPSSQDPR